MKNSNLPIGASEAFELLDLDLERLLDLDLLFDLDCLDPDLKT